MKTKFALLFTVAFVGAIGFTSCGDKCWRCKTWHHTGLGTLVYDGETELCETDAKTINQTIDYLKNDSTDGWECKAFYK